MNTGAGGVSLRRFFEYLQFIYGFSLRGAVYFSKP